MVEDVVVHLLVTLDDRALVLLPVWALNDRRQAVELEPDQYSTKMWSCFLDVTPLRAQVIDARLLDIEQNLQAAQYQPKSTFSQESSAPGVSRPLFP